MTEKTTKRQSRIRPEPDSDFLDVKQAASYCGLGVRTLYDLANRQQVPAHRVGRTLRFSRSGLDEWNYRQAMANVEGEAR
jgi:excisionase family DNA binding protein